MTRKTFSLSGSLERQTNIFFQKTWTWSLGAELLASDERDVIAATGAPRAPHLLHRRAADQPQL